MALASEKSKPRRGLLGLEAVHTHRPFNSSYPDAGVLKEKLMASSHVLVTGASTGIGHACALRLDSLGYTVFAGIRKAEDARRLQEAASPRLVPIQLDVTNPADIAAAAARISETAGERGLAGLVNNAGVAGGGPIEFVSVDAVRRLFEVNVFGLLAVTQACLPMLRQARGRVVNIGSIAGKAISPMVVPYGMSKHAVEALTDGLRLELGQAGIYASVVEPGAVKTPIWAKGVEALGDAERTLPPEALERYGAKLRIFGKVLAHLNDRGVTAELVADAVVDALEADPPRTRYLVGTDAKIRAFICRFLPNRVADAIVLRAIQRMEDGLS